MITRGMVQKENQMKDTFDRQVELYGRYTMQELFTIISAHMRAPGRRNGRIASLRERATAVPLGDGRREGN